MGEENRQYLRAVFWWAGLIALGYVFWQYLVPYLVPFVIAGFLTALVGPLVTLGERYKCPRSLATLLALLLVVGGALAAVALLVSVLIGEILTLSRQLPALYIMGKSFLDGLLDQLVAWGQIHLPNAQTLLNSQLSTVYRITAMVLRALLAVVVGLPNVLLVSVLALVAAFFLIRDQHMLMTMWEWMVPPAMRRRIPVLKLEVVRGTLGFLRAQLFLVGATAISTTLGLLVYGSHYAVLLGLIAGLLDLIPFLGPTALLGPWAAVMLIIGHPLASLELAAVLAGVALVRQLIEPRLVGAGTGLHPLTALLALYVGIRVFGPLGFFMGPITAVVIKAAAKAARLPPYLKA